MLVSIVSLRVSIVSLLVVCVPAVKTGEFESSMKQESFKE